jgi:hypothetical protein
LTHGAFWGLPTKKLQEHMARGVIKWEDHFMYTQEVRDVLRRIDEWYRGLQENRQKVYGPSAEALW